MRIGVFVPPIPILLLLSLAAFGEIMVVPVMLLGIAVIRLVFLVIPLMPVPMPTVVVSSIVSISITSARFIFLAVWPMSFLPLILSEN